MAKSDQSNKQDDKKDAPQVKGVNAENLAEFSCLTNISRNGKRYKPGDSIFANMEDDKEVQDFERLYECGAIKPKDESEEVEVEVE